MAARRERERHETDARVDLGMCAALYCPHEAAPGGRYCPAHREMVTESVRVKFARRKAHGECILCRAAAVVRANMCVTCAEKSYAAMRELTRARRALGLCVACGVPAVAGKSRCEDHLRRAVEASLRYQARKRAQSKG